LAYPIEIVNNCRKNFRRQHTYQKLPKSAGDRKLWDRERRRRVRKGRRIGSSTITCVPKTDEMMMKLWDRERRRRRVRADGGSGLRRLLNASRKSGRTQPTSGPRYSSSQLLAIPFTNWGVSLSHNCTQGGGGGVDRRRRMYTNAHRYVKFSVLRV
jgi:hypothetical protein